ncbi:MAG TPA: TIGR04283 family arsenosugar biosynthesis glycosyltransferase [Chthoniobacterales bacterium]|jgi:rSAM/selenodomain-associated transferase 2
MPPKPFISVVVPCWGDDALLQDRAWDWCDMPHVAEVIIVTASDATDLKSVGNVRVLTADRPNRGRQMNLGAEAANGDILLFHHADSDLTPDHVESIASSLSESEKVGGAFHRAFDERHPAFAWISHFERWRNQHHGSLFGDQSIFVRTEHFRKLGGFREYPLMEDMEFSQRLRKSGRIILLDPPMRSSARRHLQRGAWRTSLQNVLFIVLYHAGVSPVTLHRWYYSLKTS